jgi:hypothetical protein
MTKSAISILTVTIAVFFASCSNPAMPMMDGKASAVNGEVNLEVTDSNNMVTEKEIAVTVPVEADQVIADERDVNAGDAAVQTEEKPGVGLESEVVSTPAGDSGTEIESAPVDVAGPAFSDELNTEDREVISRGKGKDNNKGKQNGLNK